MGKRLEGLKARAEGLKKELGAVCYAFKDERVGALPKAIIGIAILYALSPIDFIPDFIPVLGYLDDLVIIPGLLGLAIKLIPREVMEDARSKAQDEPITLRKNWSFALLFIAVWALVLYAVVKALL
jgi:uncharacterized membrane protein YkvA (DUF1232 family)